MNSLTARLRHSWIGKHSMQLLIAASFLSAIITYGAISGSHEALNFKPRRVFNLMLLNLTLLGVLISIIGMRIFSMWSAMRAGTAGSRLQKRILLLFSAVSITPTIIVSIFSALFFNFGIQTWFNDRVQTAVGESLAVAEAYLAEHKENIRADAMAMASDLNPVAGMAFSDPAEFNRAVVAQSALRLLTESIVFQRNRILAEGRLSFALAFERLPQDMIDRAANGEVVIWTTDDDKVRALVRLAALPEAYLLVGRLIDSKVIDHMENAQGAVNEYKTLKSQLVRLQWIFSVVFVTLALLLLLCSIWYGTMFAARLTKPISRLAMAAERVRGGDFSARVEDENNKDEIGTLSRAFNRMTEQLEAQRRDLIDANRQLGERSRFSEAVLSGVSAGILALDGDKRLTLFNRSASAILGSIDITLMPDAELQEIFPGIQELLSRAEHLPGEVVQDTLTLGKQGRNLTLHVRVTVEKIGDRIEGFIVTFDDITLLVAAQRNAAWTDVARRVAHEIKNPLTPIQLSAERLKRKYLKYITEDADSFVKYVDTITRHVGDIGKMVEEFVSFARMPTPIFKNEDMATLLKKAVFSAQIANPAIDYTLDVPDMPVLLYADERQMNQVMTNLLKNAAEAIETRLTSGMEQETSGKIHVSLTHNGSESIIQVTDNGCGFPNAEQIHTSLDPYVTTRSKGTGLGLAIVKKIVEDHKGKINLENIPEGGARVTLSFLQHCDINDAN